MATRTEVPITLNGRAARRDVVVIGAGPAGLAAGLALKDAGLRPLLLDRADQIGASWRGRYDGLRLNTCRPFSHLPGRRFPRGTPMFPTRDQFIDHLERHAGEDGIDLELGTEVARIEADRNGWVLTTSVGEIRTSQLVVCTGYENVPFVPDWPGRDTFKGKLIHAAGYRNASPMKGRRVLVVGSRSSGMEIAHELAVGGAERVWLSVRTPPNIELREGPGPLPGDMLAVWLLRFPTRIADAVARFGRRMDLGDLSEYGLPVPEEGVFTRLYRHAEVPAIIDEEVIEAIKAGRVEIVRGVDSLDASGVRLMDGERVEPEVVVCATGYRRGLESLVGHLEVLDERGAPTAVGARAPVPGLRFVGYVQRPGGLGYMGKEAKGAARAIRNELKAMPARSPRRAASLAPVGEEAG